MAANPAVRRALVVRLGLTPQALNRRTTALKRRIPMSTEDAVYVLGHRAGVDIGRHLDAATVERIGRYVGQLYGEPPPARAGRPAATRGRTDHKVLVSVDMARFGAVPALSQKHSNEAKRMAEQVYPLLYLFENSVRDVIATVLSASFGPIWWTKVTPAAVQKLAADRLSKEEQNAWHGQRGAHPIHYVDLGDLIAIVRSPAAWPHFKDLFPRQSWLEGVIDDLGVSRNVVAHMNPISADDVKQVEAGFRKWVKQLEGKPLRPPT